MKTNAALVGLIVLFATGAVCALQGAEEEASPVGKELAAAAANVRDFGAIGDGKIDDTAALRKALDSLAESGGALYFPPGVYRTGTLKPASHVTMLGHSGWGYGGGQNLGSTILTPATDDLECLIDWRGAKGVRLDGLTLDGRKCGEGMHGVLSTHGGDEQNLVIDDCKICRFSGSGVRFEKCWVWAIRHSLIQGNGADGLDLSTSYDGWILDNQIAGNGGAGIRAQPMSTVTITGNRIEWNRDGGMLQSGGSTVQILNSTFDHNWGPGLAIDNHASAITVTGCLFRNNGARREDEDPANCHASLTNARGVAFTGNAFQIWQNKHMDRPWPRTGLRLEKLRECVIANNALHHSASHKPLDDLAGHADTVIENNPGSIARARAVHFPK